MLNFQQVDKPTIGIESLPLMKKLWVLLAGITLPKPENDEWPDDYGMAFEVHRVPSDMLSLEAWYIPAKEAKGTIVLFHGYGGSKSGVLGEAKAFHLLGYNTFLVDFRGCGESEGYLTTIGILEGSDVAASYHYIESLLESKSYVALNGRSNDQRESVATLPVMLYGRSMGAASILRAMATTDIQPDAILIDAVFAEMITAVKNRFRAIKIPSFPAAHAMIFWAGVQNGFAGFGHNPVEYASQVTVPTLVMHGGIDQMATLDEGERVFDAVPTPQKQFVCFHRAGHESYLAVQPELWHRAMRKFLASLP